MKVAKNTLSVKPLNNLTAHVMKEHLIHFTGVTALLFSENAKDRH
jgi:hypothetical protein